MKYAIFSRDFLSFSPYTDKLCSLAFESYLLTATDNRQMRIKKTKYVLIILIAISLPFHFETIFSSFSRKKVFVSVVEIINWQNVQMT